MAFITIFSAPKPFTDPHIRLIQRNALQSWLQLGEDVEIVLVGDEPGIAETASEFGVSHRPQVKKNDQGTPRVDSIFELARSTSASDLLVYVNADIILVPGFSSLVREIADALETFLVVSRRWDLNINEPLNFSGAWAADLYRRLQESGELHGHSGIDLFAFPRDVFSYIPPFAIGRSGWDNWMIFHALQAGWPVVDITEEIPIIHQNHDYHHLPEGKPHYDLEESQHNVKLAGGPRKMYSLVDANYEYLQGRIKRKSFSWLRLLRWLELMISGEEKGTRQWVLSRKIRKIWVKRDHQKSAYFQPDYPKSNFLRT